MTSFQHDEERHKVISQLLNIEALYHCQDIIITTETAQQLLLIALSEDVKKYNYELHMYESDQGKIDIIKALIISAIVNGANINEALNHPFPLILSIKKLYNYKDIILLPETAQQFLDKTRNAYLYRYNNELQQDEVDQDKLTMQKELVIASLAKGANLNKALNSFYHSKQMLDIKFIYHCLGNKQQTEEWLDNPEDLENHYNECQALYMAKYNEHSVHDEL